MNFTSFFRFSCYSLFVVCSTMLISCSDDEFEATSNERAIRFNVDVEKESSAGFRSGESGSGGSGASLCLAGGDKPVYLHPKYINGISLGDGANDETRSSITTNGNLENFGVYAALKQNLSDSSDGLSPDYMANEEVTRENNWSPVDDYLWPGKGGLHFWAYAPYCNTPGEEGITALPSKTDKGPLSISFTTPSKVADQFDLLYANPVDASASPCNLTFNHALTAIRFATGNEMVPCKVKEITISNVLGKGVLSLDNGVWSNLTSRATYSVNPEVSLTAAKDSKYVAADTYITSEDESFILIPQTLDSDASLSITFDVDGKESTLQTSLEGAQWNQGITIVYRLSINPKEEGYILELTDSEGNPISALSSNYTGSQLNFNIKSAYGDAADENSQVNVSWKAEFLDDNGNVISQPDWISSWTMSGKGSTSLESQTQMQTPIFEAISEESSALRSAGDINASSGYRPYNLSNSTGQASVKNTANCYLIHAPGFYSLPLVYGNAIVDGNTNTSAYIATSSSNVHILKNMVNHLGDAITDPYIYNNAGCTPADAVLVWEGRLNLIQNVGLSADKKRLIFQISPNFICQGNAIVAVRDASGTILWSWHIWVTPYEPDNDPITIAYHGKNYSMMSQNLGQITAGDRANFKERKVNVRYTQIPADDSAPLSVTVTLTQSGKIIETPDSYNYYQWGRKDPMISTDTQWYTSDDNEITTIWTKDYSSDRTPGLPIIADYIRTPGYFWISPHDNEVFPYYNLWNTNNSTTAEVKTIYDPSPVGYMVARNVLTALNNANSTPTTGKYGVGVNLIEPTSGEQIFFPTHGYRQSGTGLLQGNMAGSEIGTVWSSRTTSTTSAGALVLGVTASTARLVASEVRSMAFGVRASKEL